MIRLGHFHCETNKYRHMRLMSLINFCSLKMHSKDIFSQRSARPSSSLILVFLLHYYYLWRFFSILSINTPLKDKLVKGVSCCRNCRRGRSSRQTLHARMTQFSSNCGSHYGATRTMLNQKKIQLIADRLVQVFFYGTLYILYSLYLHFPIHWMNEGGINLKQAVGISIWTFAMGQCTRIVQCTCFSVL